MNLVPVKDYPDLAKDLDTGAIVNINKDKHAHARRINEQRKKDKQEIEDLKSDVKEIKMLLHKLLENG